MRACGVLETVRISAAGYPSRWTYTEFLKRYNMLLTRRERNKSMPRLECETIVRKILKDEDKFQFGVSKIFFRAGQVAFLEKRRTDCMSRAAVNMQARIRGWLQCKRFRKLKSLAINLQCLIRRKIARDLALHLHRTRVATMIQAIVRSWLARRRYLRYRDAILSLQCLIRGNKARRMFQSIRQHQMAIKIQSYIRSYLVRSHYRQYIRSVIILQSCVRRRIARKQLRQLRIEAKSVDGLKQINYGLERKIIELQQKMDTKVHDATFRQSEKIAELERAVEAAKGSAMSLSHSSQTLLERRDKELAEVKLALTALELKNSELHSSISHAKGDTDATIHELKAQVLF